MSMVCAPDMIDENGTSHPKPIILAQSWKKKNQTNPSLEAFCKILLWCRNHRKQEKCEKPSQPRGEQGDVTMKCNAVS